MRPAAEDQSNVGARGERGSSRFDEPVDAFGRCQKTESCNLCAACVFTKKIGNLRIGDRGVLSRPKLVGEMMVQPEQMMRPMPPADERFDIFRVDDDAERA